MKYLLPCKCGQSVEIEPGQAGQMVVCACGENLLVPSMLQIKVLLVAPDKPIVPDGKIGAPFKAALATFILGVVCLVLSVPLWWFGAVIEFGVCFGSGLAFLAASVAVALRTQIRPDDTNILSRTFFIIGIVFLFPSFLLALYLYAWTPDPRHATIKRTQFSYGTYQKPLYQDSTPISPSERNILWMTDEYIDQMMPMDLYLYFQTLKEPMFSSNFLENYEAVKETYRIWVIVNIILFLLAFSGMIVSFFMPTQNVVVTGWSGSEW